MKWPTVKNLMLGLLLVMNLFMLSTLLVKRFNSEMIPPLAREATVDAMENSGIICADSLIPEKYLTIKGLKGAFPTAIELSRMFFGEQLAFQTEDRTLIATRDGAELVVGDQDFSYKSGKPGVDAGEKELRRALDRLGLDVKNAAYDSVTGRFEGRYDGKPVFGMYIKASLDAQGSIARIDACWPRLYAGGGNYSGVSIMNCLPGILDRLSDKGEVKAIEAGYSFAKTENTDTLAFQPSWRFTMEKGGTEVFPWAE